MVLGQGNIGSVMLMTGRSERTAPARRRRDNIIGASERPKNTVRRLCSQDAVRSMNSPCFQRPDIGSRDGMLERPLQ